MPGRTPARAGLASVLLAGAAVLLACRFAGAAHQFPPLAAFGPAAAFPLQPAILLMEVSMTRCRTLFVTGLPIG